MIAGAGLRAFALLVGIFMERVMHSQYTDYDYKVFSDASLCVLNGQSPFDRITYRYTPLLAYMMTPNWLLFYEFGKFVFSILDLLCAYLLDKILTKLSVPSSTRTFAISIWLFFPLTAIISTRGSADCLIVFLSLLTLYYVLEERYNLAAIVYGIAVHFKIYPIIYAIPLFLFIKRLLQMNK